MRKARVIMVAAGACGVIVAAGGATAALASIPSANGVIHGCYSSTGALRVVNATTCPAGQKTLSWNQKGATGPAGPSTTFYVVSQEDTIQPGGPTHVQIGCTDFDVDQATGGSSSLTYGGSLNSGPEATSMELDWSGPWSNSGFPFGWGAWWTNHDTVPHDVTTTAICARN